MEKKNKPEIRFKGYNENWGNHNLKSLCENIEYGLNAASKLYDGVNKYLRITDIDDSSREFLSNGITSPNKDLTNADNFILKKGDILFARTGASVGKSYIYKEKDGKVYFAGFLIRARLKEKINSELIFQQTLTDKYNKFIRVTSQRSGQPGVNAQEFGELFFNLPITKTEQQKIGNFFDNLDNLINQHQQKHSKLKAIKKAMLNKMFPKQGQLVPEIRFKGFEGEWKEKELSEIINLQSGRDYKHLEVGNVPVYGTGGYMTSVNDALSYKEDSIGIGRKGTIDKPYILRAPFWTVDTLFYAIPLISNDLQLLNCIFQKINWKQKDESTGVPSLSKNTINSVLVKIPDKDEQNIIGNYFKNLDELIENHETQITKLQNIKKAFLAKMFI